MSPSLRIRRIHRGVGGDHVRCGHQISRELDAVGVCVPATARSRSFIEAEGNFGGMAGGDGAVLVTGATGSVGRFVVSSLANRGVPVRQ